MSIRRVLVAGIVASLVMGMIEMVYEALAGDGFWSPAVYIGATVLRGLQSVQIPVAFNFWGVVLGLMGHMMNSRSTHRLEFDLILDEWPTGSTGEALHSLVASGDVIAAKSC